MSRPPRFPRVAMALAVIAVVVAASAVVVVVKRGAGASSPAMIERHVTTGDILKLQKTESETVLVKAGVGVHVLDAELDKALGLVPDDAILAISGHHFSGAHAMAGTLELIALVPDTTGLFVELVHDGQPMVLQWTLDGDLYAAYRASRSSAYGSSPSPPPVPAAPDPRLDTIVKLDDTHYVVPRATFESFKNAGSSASLGGARIVPSSRLGQPSGFKLYAIRSTSVFAALGFASGDEVTAINGLPVTTPNQALEVYAATRDAHELVIELTRRGKPETLTITIK